MKSGFVSIIGKPNVGKSTLINRIIGSKISIVSPKSQTTRNSIEGIYNDDDSQIVFIDTPGIHKPFNELGKALDKISYGTIRDCEVCLLMVDAGHSYSDDDAFLCEHIQFDCKLVVVFNKIDTTNIELISIVKKKYEELFPSAIFAEICAKDGFGVEDLVKTIKNNLDEGPRYFDVTQVTDRDLKFRIQEIVREKLLLLLKEEVPHGAMVMCEDIRQEGGKTVVYANIIVEKDGHKGIVIGKGGKMIKKIGTYSRQDIEQLIGKHIILDLNVKVVENWRNSSSFLARSGYKF